MWRKGQTTIPDLLAVGTVIFIFGSLSPVILDALGTGFQNTNLLGKILLAVFPAIFIILIIGAIFALQEPNYEYKPGR